MSAATTFIILASQVVLDTFLFPVLLVHIALLAAAGLAWARTWWRAEAIASLTTGASDKQPRVPAAGRSEG